MDYRIEVNGTELDLPAGAQAPVVARRLFDPNTTAPSVGDLTFNLVLPRTARNEAALLWAYMPDRPGGANILPVLQTTVTAGSTLLLQGEMEIGSVTEAGIQARVYGLNTEWLARLEGRVLQDLPVGTLPYSGAEADAYAFSLFDVWETTEADGLGVQFPLVSYGNFAADPTNTNPNPLNDGAQTIATSAGIVDGALIDNRSDWGFAIEEFRPALYLRHVVRQVLAAAGLAASGEFFEDPYFADILLPYTNDNDEGFTLPYTFIEEANFEATQVKSSSTYTGSIVDDPNGWLSGQQTDRDVGGNPQQFVHWLTVNTTRSGVYRFRWQQALDLFPGDFPVRYFVGLYAGGIGGPLIPPADGSSPIYLLPNANIVPPADEVTRSGEFEVFLTAGTNYRFKFETWYNDLAGGPVGTAGIYTQCYLDRQVVSGELDLRLALPRMDALEWLRGTLNHFGLVLSVSRDGRSADVRPRQSLYLPTSPAYSFDRADYRAGTLEIPRQPATVVLDYALEEDEALLAARQFAATHTNGRGYHQGEEVRESLYSGTANRSYTWLTQGILTEIPTLNTRDEFAKLLGRLGDGSELPKYSYLMRLLRWKGLQPEPDASEGLWVDDVEYLKDGAFAWPRSTFVDTPDTPDYIDELSLSFNDEYGAPGLYARFHRLPLQVIARAQQLEVEGLVYPHEVELWQIGTALEFAGHRWAVVGIEYRPAADEVTKIRLIKIA